MNVVVLRLIYLSDSGQVADYVMKDLDTSTAASETSVVNNPPVRQLDVGIYFISTPSPEISPSSSNESVKMYILLIML